jgi:hypothetical protein
MDKNVRHRCFLKHMAKATQLKYGLDKPSVGIRCAYAFVHEIGPDWTPDQVAAKGRLFWLQAPNLSKKGVAYIEEWLRERGIGFTD